MDILACVVHLTVSALTQMGFIVGKQSPSQRQAIASTIGNLTGSFQWV